MKIVSAQTRLILQVELDADDRAEITELLDREFNFGVKLTYMDKMRLSADIVRWIEDKFNLERELDPKFGQAFTG